MEEKSLTPIESLAIIEQMMTKAKENVSNDSFYFILWGWLVFIASLANFILDPILKEDASLVWLLMPLGGLISFIYGKKQNKKQDVKTYIESYLGYLWLAMGFAMAIIMFVMIKFNNQQVMPMFILLYAIGTFTSGGILQFKPLIIGGSISFILCVVAFFVTDYYQLLFIALSVLLSYIIPGHLLKAKYSSHGA